MTRGEQCNGHPPTLAPEPSAVLFISPLAFVPRIAKGDRAPCYSELKGCSDAPRTVWTGYGCGWAPGWDATVGWCNAAGVCRFPMPIHGRIDGERQYLLDHWDEVAARCLEAGHALGHNEPDVCATGGGCENIEQVVADWPTLEALCLAGQCKLISPALSHLTGPEAWYAEFWRLCPACRVDGFAWHCHYQDLAGCEALSLRYLAMYQQRGMTGGLWISEFSSLPRDNWSRDRSAAEVEDFVEFCEAHGIHYSLYAYEVNPATDWWAMGHVWNSWINPWTSQRTVWGESMLSMPCERTQP